MRDLFQMDAKDYNPDGQVFRRPSVRAVIERDGMVLLIYSQKYDYYKFPGGGVEAGESHEEALIREVAEESGYQIVSGSIREFGRVLRRHKDFCNENDIFEQENFYYFCEVTGEPVSVSLDDYEREEGFTAVWMEPFTAARHNCYRTVKGGDSLMVEREGRVLDLVDLELLRRARAGREAAAVRALGNLDYAGMLDFVEEKLREPETEDIGAKATISCRWSLAVCSQAQPWPLSFSTTAVRAEQTLWLPY